MLPFTKLVSKVAVITGGSRGIGLGVAEAFAEQGFRVAVLSRSSACHEAAAGLPVVSGGGAHAGFECNVASSTSVKATFDEVEQWAGSGVGVLVNAAGVTANRLLMRTSDADMEQVMQTNLQGSIRCCQAVSKGMTKNRNGVIINVGSVVGAQGNRGQTVYSASKAGLHGLTTSLAKELGSRNVRVNMVEPGFIATGMTEDLTEVTKTEVAKRTCLGHIGTLEDVVHVFPFLASDHAAYISAQTLRVDGGLSL